MFGITENGDASLNYDWMDHVYGMDGSILITKKLTKDFKMVAMALSYLPIILHVSCTGYGGSVLEPNLDPYPDTIDGIRELLDLGFPTERIVLRIDPIIPTDKGIALFKDVVSLAREVVPEVTRIRISVMDMYPHVRKRFAAKGLPCPYGDNFKASRTMFNNLNMTIERLKKHYPNLNFETCAETDIPAANAVGCVSAEDYKILGLPMPSDNKKGQRKGCLCLGEKQDMLKFKYNETGYNHCYGCLYCYWQTEKDK